jgi:cysteine desulfurase
MEVTYLKPKANGLINLNVLKNIIRPTTLCVSTLFLNNEIGVIQPIKEIGKICKEKGCFFHVDGA